MLKNCLASTFGFIIILLSNLVSKGQKIEKNIKDDMTGDRIIQTDYSYFKKGFNDWSFYRFNSFNKRIYFDIKISLGSSVFSIREGMELILKFENDSIIKLTSPLNEISRRGQASIGLMGSELPGVNIGYPINQEILYKFQNWRIKKVRVYTSEGFKEWEVNDDYKGGIQERAFLLLEALD
jgi:hypothetical protein